MHIRARALCLCGALIAAIFLLTSSVAAQQPPKKEQKPDKAQLQEQEAAVKTVNDAMAGQPGPADVTITWQHHYLKARDQRTYVPMVLTFDEKLNGQVVYYLRAVNKNAPPPAPPKKEAPRRDAETGELLEPEQKPAPRPEYPFEDIRFIEVKSGPAGQPHHLTVAMSLPPGEYDVYALLRQRMPKDAKKNAPPPTGGLMKQTITVPNFWAQELMTSSVILSNKAEQLTSPPTEVADPYVFGATKVAPSADNKFAKNDELSIIFQIYNTAPAASGKPDVTVEYNFYQKTGGAEKFFNKTNPQLFNADTLPAQFDLAAGHTLVGGLSIPLTSFPEGEYRLEIKVTDKAANKSKVENLALTVGA